MGRAAVRLVATGIAVVAVALASPGPASAEAGCSLELLSDSPVALDKEGHAEVVVASSCRDLAAASDNADLAIDPPSFTPAANALPADPPSPVRRARINGSKAAATGKVTVSSPGGPTLVVPVGPAKAKTPKVEILSDKTEAATDGGGETTVHLTVKVTEAPVLASEVRAAIALISGAQAGARHVVARLVPTDALPQDGSIGADRTAVLDITFAGADLTGGGGQLVLFHQPGDAGPAALASTPVTFQRRPTTVVAALLFLLPLALAVVVILIAAKMITERRRRDVAPFEAALAPLTTALADPTLPPSRRTVLQHHADALSAAIAMLKTGSLPAKAKWTFNDGFAGSFAGFSAALAALLGATGLLDRYFAGVGTGPFVAANIFFGGAIAAAVLVYNAFADHSSGEPEGTLTGLYVAAGVSLWGVFGFAAALALLLFQLDSDAARIFFIAVLGATTAVSAVYAVQNLRGRARLDQDARAKLDEALKRLPASLAAPGPIGPPPSPGGGPAQPEPTHRTFALAGFFPAAAVVEAMRTTLTTALDDDDTAELERLLDTSTIAPEAMVQFLIEPEAGPPVVLSSVSPVDVALAEIEEMKHDRGEVAWGVV
jgi:hypothetical protein